MHILTSAAFQRMPWKNGGGVTTEIAVSPAGATLDAFDWRVSMADVASDGAFSLFAGIDRTLSVLEGEGISLEFGEAGTTRLTGANAPFSFAADAPVSGRLHDGPIRDLNVMSRRGKIEHRVARYIAGEEQVFDVSDNVLMLLALHEGANVSCDGVAFPIAAGDAAITDPRQDRLVKLQTRSVVFAITFRNAVRS